MTKIESPRKEKAETEASVSTSSLATRRSPLAVLFSPLASSLSFLHKAYWIAKGVGWDNVPRRIYHMAMIKSGRLERVLEQRLGKPPNGLHFIEAQKQAWLERRARFLPIPSTEQLKAVTDASLWNEHVTRVCKAALDGQYPFFGRWTGELGWPPKFNLDPLNNIDWPINKHWLRTARSGPPRNDIKLVWEASRFTLAYYLARAYVYDSDEVYAKSFWEMFDTWVEQNPVNHTVAWGCGQEISFRLMAILTAAFTMLDSEHTTDTRLAKLEELSWQFATRIEANINYAISQENNHALSEAAGLWTVGLLFPDFDESAKWVKKAKHIFESEIQRQVYSDGSFVQHSMTYHRVMLDVMLWVVELGKANGCTLTSATIERLRTAAEWLQQFLEPNDGRVPNYGSNDGASVLPLSCSDYLDFRPVLHAACVSFGVSTTRGLGPWCEKSLWLAGKTHATTRTEELPPTWSAPVGGYHVMRGPQSLAFVRAAHYRDRPGQCDMLHLDLWIKGLNILRDSGSYRYYHEDPSVKKYFYSVVSHNTVQVAGQEQMEKGPNFLWFNWPEGVANFDKNDRLVCKANFKGNTAYEHNRIIERVEDAYIIQDSVVGAELFDARWHLAPELDWRVTGHNVCEAECGHQGKFVVRFEAKQASTMALEKAWESLYYGERREIPCITLLDVRGQLRTSIGWKSS